MADASLAPAHPGRDPTPATVYFDGACPVCTREIAALRRLRGAEVLEFVDVTACPTEALGPGLTRQAALASMHVRRTDGSLARGAAAFATLWGSLPATARLGRLVGHPAVLPVAERAYRGFVRLRRLWR